MTFRDQSIQYRSVIVENREIQGFPVLELTGGGFHIQQRFLVSIQLYRQVLDPIGTVGREYLGEYRPRYGIVPRLHTLQLGSRSNQFRFRIRHLRRDLLRHVRQNLIPHDLIVDHAAPQIDDVFDSTTGHESSHHGIEIIYRTITDIHDLIRLTVYLTILLTVPE